MTTKLGRILALAFALSAVGCTQPQTPAPAPGSSTSALTTTPYAGRTRSFCVVDDFACQVEGTTRGHIAYFTNGMRAEGTALALEQIALG